MFLFNCALFLIKVCRIGPIPGTEQSHWVLSETEEWFSLFLEFHSYPNGQRFLAIYTYNLASLPAACTVGCSHVVE
jgi:hypothetical protein